ncbi:MAG: hypothetical protein LJE85_03085 [Gammaproteobacteria bacterium]|nr:hypothetical protein [Gammaproteobacteria bacterium]
MGEHNHRFDDSLWAVPGLGIDYDRTEEVRDEIILLRQYYPELDHWSDLAIFMAWGSFSQDNHDMNWSPVFCRDEIFPAYLYFLEQGGNILEWSADDAQQDLTKIM